MSQGLESQTLKGERRDKMRYNYSKLLGRIKEYGFTHERLAEAIGKNKAVALAAVVIARVKPAH